MSDFWKRVDEEIDFKGINRAFLARKCGFSVTNIGQGIKLGSTPSAETAVKIADVLGVSVEYLVTGENQSSVKQIEQEQVQLKLYRKYHELISKCEKLPERQVEFLGLVADRLEK
ncbi:MAG: helix-turn-helix transcriptional regulator [Treponema sp.]|nr:helix-turn-helix transcriptional regulator [Treponema sp.]